jgi:hypothetical protein
LEQVLILWLISGSIQAPLMLYQGYMNGYLMELLAGIQAL